MTSKLNLDVLVFQSAPNVGKYRNIKYIFKLYCSGVQIYEMGLEAGDPEPTADQEEIVVALFEVNGDAWMNCFILNIALVGQIPIEMAKKTVPVFFDTYQTLWNNLTVQTQFGQAQVYQKQIDEQTLINPYTSTLFEPHYSSDLKAAPSIGRKYNIKNIRRLCLAGDKDQDLLIRTLFLSVFEFLDPKIQTQILRLYNLEGNDGLRILMQRITSPVICQIVEELEV